MEADIPVTAAGIGIEVASVLDAEHIGVCEEGAVGAACHALIQQELAALHRCDHRDHRAERAVQLRVGQVAVQGGQLHPAQAADLARRIQDGNAQKLHILPGVGQPEALGPAAGVGQTFHLRLHPGAIAGEQVGVKFQIPAVVQLQPLGPGNLRDTAEKDYVLIRRAFGVEIGVAQIKARGGVGSLIGACIGGDVEHQVSAAAPGQPQGHV